MNPYTQQQASWTAKAIVAAGIFVIIVQLVQCWILNNKITGVKTDIRDIERENKDRQIRIEQLHKVKSSELMTAAETLSSLDGRLERNQILETKTEEARKKLELIKTLMKKYETIKGKLESLKRQFPELQEKTALK